MGVYLSEKTSLLKQPTEPPLDVKSEFLSLSSMALQVSLATFARMALYSIDYAFLGHVGTTELAAAALSTVWISTPLLMIWNGGLVILTLCGHAVGAGNKALAGVWLQMGVTIATLCVAPLFIWNWCIGFALEWSSDDPEVVRLGLRFARILSFSIWPNLMYVCMRMYFQSLGVMMPTTVVGVLSIGVSIGANYFLIYGCFGWSGFGFDGSALATVVASWFQPLALYAYCVLYKQLHLQAWSGWNFADLTRDRLKTFLDMAVPICLNNLVVTLASSGLALIAAQLGSEAIAANTIILGFWRLLWALFWGFGTATQIRVANFLGAGRPEAAKMLGKLGTISTIVCVAFLAAIAVIMRGDIFRLYTNDSVLLRMCLSVLPIFISGFIFESIEMLLMSILTAMGQVKVTAWTSTFATWCVELPFAYLFGVTLGYGFSALWYSICLLEVIKLTVYAITLVRTDWTQMAKRAQKNTEMTDETKPECEEDALNTAMAEEGGPALGIDAGLPSPGVGSLLTPSRTRVHQWEQQDEMTPRNLKDVNSYA